MSNEESGTELKIRLGDVPATSLITLYSRALESQTQEPILTGPLAVETTQKLRPEFAKSDNKYYENG